MITRTPEQTVATQTLWEEENGDCMKEDEVFFPDEKASDIVESSVMQPALYPIVKTPESHRLIQTYLTETYGSLIASYLQELFSGKQTRSMVFTMRRIAFVLVTPTSPSPILRSL